MYLLKKIAQKEEKRIITIIKSFEAKSLNIAITLEAKRKADNDSINNKEIREEKRSVNRIAIVRNLKKKVSYLICSIGLKFFSIHVYPLLDIKNLFTSFVVDLYNHSS